MRVPYWLQMAIWPLIRDTDCYYCIFIRGALYGALLTCLMGALWAALYL
jgi:hypothetical protein